MQEHDQQVLSGVQTRQGQSTVRRLRAWLHVLPEVQVGVVEDVVRAAEVAIVLWRQHLQDITSQLKVPAVGTWVQINLAAQALGNSPADDVSGGDSIGRCNRRCP